MKNTTTLADHYPDIEERDHFLWSQEGLGRLEVPNYAFLPDEWSESVAEGLASVARDLKGKTILEVGVGTGINTILALREFGVKKFYGTDIDRRLAYLTKRNLAQICPDLVDQYEPLAGRNDLLNFRASQPTELDSVEFVFGCIPQATTTAPDQLDRPDFTADYYDPDRYSKSRFNHLGLGLNHTFLQQARQRFPRSSVALNLGGRVGKSVLLELFAETGYAAEVVNTKIIPQCSKTDISPFLDLANQGAETEFFADPAGRFPLSAQKALASHEQGQPIYHALYFIKGTPIN